MIDSDPMPADAPAELAPTETSTTAVPDAPDVSWMVCEPAVGPAAANEAERVDAPAPPPQEG